MSTEDIAQDVELAEWRRRNELRQPQPVFKPSDSGYGPEVCQNEDCEDTMPEVRRSYGRLYCTACETRRERKQCLYAY